MHKTYLSVAMSRAWGFDNPIGDPFGGPAYGARESLGIVAAVASVAAGVGMIGTGVAITALGGITVGTLVGGALIAGGVLSGVGTLTGNQKLVKWGNTLSMFGGVATIGAGMVGGWQNAAAAEGATFGSKAMGALTGAVDPNMIKAGMDSVGTSFNQFTQNISGSFSSAPVTQGSGVSTANLVDKGPGAPASQAGATAMPGSDPAAAEYANNLAAQAKAGTLPPGTITNQSTMPAPAGVDPSRWAAMNDASRQQTLVNLSSKTGDTFMGMSPSTITAAGMGAQAIGSMVAAKANEKAAAEQARVQQEYNDAMLKLNERKTTLDETMYADQKKKLDDELARRMEQITVVSTQAEYDALSAAGEAAVLWSPPALAAPASPQVAAPQTRWWNFDVRGAANSGVVGAVA